MSDRAEEVAMTHVRVLANDTGIWGIDVRGMWFPCDGDTQEDVVAMATDVRREFAAALRAYAEEVVKKWIEESNPVWLERVEEARREDRKACERVAESWMGRRLEGEYPDTPENQAWGRGVDMAAYSIAAAIRARGEKG